MGKNYTFLEKSSAMKFFIIIFISICLITNSANARRGCCSHHGGVSGCSGGRQLCRDGTLSPSCTCSSFFDRKEEVRKKYTHSKYNDGNTTIEVVPLLGGEKAHMYTYDKNGELFEEGILDIDGAGEINTYKNNKLIAKSTVKNGMTDGPVETYYETGELRSTVNFKKDKKEGIEIFYDKKGNVIVEQPYKNGKLHGTLRRYSENNTLIEEGEYSKGKKDGKYNFYDENGNLVQSQEYDDDFMDGTVKSYENGILVSKIDYSDGMKDGTSYAYDSEGKLESKVEYKKGVMHGTSKFYYPNGELKVKVDVKNNEKHGTEKYYYDTGDLQYKVEFENGKPVGDEIGYYKNGDKKYVASYENGICVRGYCFNEEGKKRDLFPEELKIIETNSSNFECVDKRVSIQSIQVRTKPKNKKK